MKHYRAKRDSLPPEAGWVGHASRGGDQVAEHTPDGYTFYGGVSHGVEKRSRVKSRLIANAFVDLIKEAESVVIMGHKFSDLDSVGAAEGVLRICKICKKPDMRCINICPGYETAACKKLDKPPYVCNGCTKKTYCLMPRKFYSSKYAQDEYRSVLVDCRVDINQTPESIQAMNETFRNI